MKLFTFILVSILTGIELDLFIPSFPEMQRFFDISTFETQMALSINFISYCIGAILVGWLGDRYPRKHVMVCGLSLFVLGSLLCVFPFTYDFLLLGRALQGIGISAPSILIPVLIADDYPEDKQVHLFGLIHGTCAIAMSFAPIAGSYISLLFSWRANFIALLICGVLCLILALYYIKPSLQNVVKSSFYRSYISCILSKNFWLIGLVIWFATAPYWVFIGMAPLLYMDRMTVSLETFGIYQGSLALAFAIPSLFSGVFIKKFGRKACFNFGCICSLITCVIILLVGIFESYNPFFVTGSFIPCSIGVAFLVNMLYPAAMSLHKNDKSKITALLIGMRLLICSFFLQLASYYGHQDLFPTAAVISFSILLSFVFIILLLRIIPKVVNIGTIA